MTCKQQIKNNTEAYITMYNTFFPLNWPLVLWRFYRCPTQSSHLIKIQNTVESLAHRSHHHQNRTREFDWSNFDVAAKQQKKAQKIDSIEICASINMITANREKKPPVDICILHWNRYFNLAWNHCVHFWINLSICKVPLKRLNIEWALQLNESFALHHEQKKSATVSLEFRSRIAISAIWINSSCSGNEHVEWIFGRECQYAYRIRNQWAAFTYAYRCLPGLIRVAKLMFYGAHIIYCTCCDINTFIN